MKIQNYREFLNEAAKFTTERTHSDAAMYGLWLRNQIHLFHWQTEVGDAHKALGDFYDGFLDKLDNLTEVCMGKHGRVLATPTITKPLQNLKDVNVQEFVDIQISYYEKLRAEVYSDSSDIQNIIDEIIADMNKLKYLLTMS
jgi:DNA-binding ferritin-like protein